MIAGGPSTTACARRRMVGALRLIFGRDAHIVIAPMPILGMSATIRGSPAFVGSRPAIIVGFAGANDPVTAALRRRSYANRSGRAASRRRSAEELLPFSDDRPRSSTNSPGRV